MIGCPSPQCATEGFTEYLALNARVWWLTSSRLSKRQLLPSSVTSFQYRRPTSRRPETFFTCDAPFRHHRPPLVIRSHMNGVLPELADSGRAEAGRSSGYQAVARLTVQKSSMSDTIQMTNVDMNPRPKSPDSMYTTNEAACTANGWMTAYVTGL